MAPLSRLGYSSQPMGAGDWGQQAMPFTTPSFAAAPQTPRGMVAPVNTDFAQRYASTKNPDRPYEDIGKETLNLANPAAFASNLLPAKGIAEGFGMGAGRLVGSFFDRPGSQEWAQRGESVGGTVGHIAQIPMDALGAVMGALPAIPGLPGGGSIMPGQRLWQAPEAERKAFLEQWDGNPFGLFKALGDYDKEAFNKEIEDGRTSALMRPFGPATNLGEQFINTLGILGLPSDLIQRGWAGGPGEAIKRIMDAPEEELNPEIVALRERYKAGEVKDEQFLDQLVVSGAGYSNNWVLNLLGSAVLDPANLAMGAGTAIGLASKSAKVAQAVRFADDIGEVGAKALARSFAERTLAESGEVIAENAVHPMQMIEEAGRLGTYGDQIAAAAKALPGRQQLALSPGFARMEKIADITQSVLDPTNLIGRRGTKPITNAYLSREGTKGVAQAYGIENYSRLGDALDGIGKGHLFNDGVGYFGAQEGVLMAGDSLANDIASIRRISSHRPTDVAMARAGVGSQNYAMKMEKWVARRKADLAMLSGGTKEQAMARAEAHARDRLTRLGLNEDEAAQVLAKVGRNEDGYSLIDAMYFGNRIKSYNAAKRAARESLAAQIASNADGLPTKAQAARLATLDRATLIGPRELTDLRGKLLRDALDAGDIDAVRDAVRRYDVLASEFLADGTEEAVLLKGVKSWLDEFQSGLTKELDDESLKRLPRELGEDVSDDGYKYGLRPEGEDEWRLAFHDEDDLANGIKAGDIKHARPWIDIVGDAAEPWNMRFRDTGGRVQSLANTLERKTRLMGQQITSDKIDRESRRRFVEGAMTRGAKPVEGQVGQGLTYAEGREMYDAVKRRALEASTAPRGLSLDEFNSIIHDNKAVNRAASRVGIAGRDLMMLTLQSFEGNIGTVGITQKLSGKAKVIGANVPLMPANAVGQIAERMYPLIRFTLNPVFQMQEWVEPWVFSAARGRVAKLTGTWKNPITGEMVTLDDVQMIQQHMIDRYKAASPESQFDMMERSLIYLHGAKAAKEAAAATDRNMLRQAIHNFSVVNVAERKSAAQSEMFRYFLGPMLKDQFDKINPNIWFDLEKTFGTKDQGQIAMRWLVEKDAWASADPKVAYHLMDVSKEPAMGMSAAVNLIDTAEHVFKTSIDGLNTRVKSGAITREAFADTMAEVGAHPGYVDRAWKVLEFNRKTGGVDQWWDDAAGMAAGGKAEIDSVRAITRALAETRGITESELLSRTIQNSPVSLMHDDMISMVENDLAAWGTLLQMQKDMVRHFRVDPVTGATTVERVPGLISDMELLHAWQNPPTSIPIEQHGNILKMENVQFGEDGRTLWVPGGKDALADLETPWTAWEAHVIRSQILNPNDLKDPALKHALDEKMWRGHIIDMEDPANTHAVFNNYMFAMHSANMTLTRNEMVATRFRVSSMEELRDLASEGATLRATIEASDSTSPLVNDLGLAYSTKPGVSHYIPLDDRLRHMDAGMLPERTTTEMKKGVPVQKKYKATRALVEERADAASRYLRGTTKADRARFRAMEEADKGGPLTNWAVEQIADAVNRDGINAFETLAGTFGTVRAAKIGAGEQQPLLDAAGRLVEALAKGEDDEAARALLTNYATKWKDHDANVIFKPWNVNGAAIPGGKIDGSEFFHGDIDDTFAYLKNDDVSWRGTATSANMGRSLKMAQDIAENPGFFVRRPGEALDEFGERISHRTDGLSLKTGFFGTDLGNPLEFPKGVHDLHMVGDLTEWMYYTKGAKGTNEEWTKWVSTLSDAKKERVNAWIAEGAPRGAGVFKWGEAQGVPINFKPGDADARMLDAATLAERGAWVRRRLDEAVADPKKPGITQAQRDRMGRMYRTDEEWGDLYGRDIKMYGGDYQQFEETMTRRKMEAEALGGPEAEGLKRHGNGGYQWKLWDERRHIWDPETTAFASSHGMPRRDIRYYASSDDAHNAAGFYRKEGQPSVDEVGYSALDPWNTVQHQRDGRVVRGATILTDGPLGEERLIGLTQYRDRSTFLHEVTHAILEPMLTDESLKRVVFEDLNAVIRDRNASLITRTAELRTALDEATAQVVEREAASTTAQAARTTAKKAADDAATALRQAEREAARLSDAVTMQQGALKQLLKDAPAKRKAAQARRYPSEQARGLESVEATLTREQEKLDALIKSRDQATAAVDPARTASTTASEAHVAASEQARLADADLKAGIKTRDALTAEHADVSTRAPEVEKFGWDNDVSEHFADEFAKYLATGEAKNPQLRDAFAYFRKVLIRIFDWAKANPKAKVSPEMQKLFDDLTTPIQKEREVLANAVPFNATEEAMHAAGIQSVVDAEDAAYTNVQFRRGRSWLERSINHPYLGIYPSSYMWGKVAPEMVRTLARNPFGLPIPILTQPVRLNSIPGLKQVAAKMGKTLPEGEFGLHGSPFFGFVNAARVQNAIELQKDTDPEFAAMVNDPKNEKVFRNLQMFLPATPWDMPANYPLWLRRIAEYGAETNDEPLKNDGTPKTLDAPKMAGEIVSYAFGPKAGFDWLSDTMKLPNAPMFGGEGENEITPQSLKIGPEGIVPISEQLGEASEQLQQQLPQPQQP